MSPWSTQPSPRGWSLSSNCGPLPRRGGEGREHLRHAALFILNPLPQWGRGPQFEPRRPPRATRRGLSRTRVRARGLPLLPQGAGEEAADQVALQADNEGDGRDAGKDGGRRDVAPGHLEDAGKERERHGHGAAGFGRRERVGEEELVPREEKGQEGC